MSDRQPWTEQEVELLRQVFSDPAYTKSRLAELFGRSSSAVYNKAKMLGLERNNPAYRHWTQEEEQLLGLMYPHPNVSREEMQRAFGRTWSNIESKANDLGFRRPHPTRITIHRDYFRVIDTAEKAYWLGFLAADGSVHVRSDKKQLSFSLQKKDLHWLTKYRDTIAPGATITPQGAGSFCVSIASKEMVQDLAQYGIVPRKTKTLTFPERISGGLAMPFILGYFDGDGNLYCYKFINTMTWSLLGTYDFLSVAREYLMYYAEVEIHEPRRHKKFRVPHLFEIRVHGARAERVDRALNASGLGLPRKHLPR